LFIITLTANTSALRLNEIESNPAGSDSGAEWVELYSENEVNLEDYYLENGDGGKYNLSGSFSGYLVITFSILWLDNTNETVYIKQNNNVIDSAGPFADSKNNELTYSLCSNEWKMISSTKGAENNCEDNEEESNTDEEEQIEQAQETREETPIEKKKEVKLSTPTIEEISPQKTEKISLGKKQEIKEEVTKTYKTRQGVIYFFLGFCILLVVLIALKRL
jgi:hypothetical protein